LCASEGEPVIVELSADKEQKQLEVELITDSYGTKQKAKSKN